MTAARPAGAAGADGADRADGINGAAPRLRAWARAARAAGAECLVGLVGQGIAASLTPPLHEAEARAQGLALAYLRIDLDDTAEGAEALPAILRAAGEEGFAGLNITYPCKQAVLALLDAASGDVRAMGAANTVVFEAAELSELTVPLTGSAARRRIVGHNTDGSGWRWGFERALPGAEVSNVVLIGAGGAGSAIAHALCSMGCQQLRIVDAAPHQAARLAAELRRQHAGIEAVVCSDAAAALAGASGLVHATPMGMDKRPGLPFDASLLAPSMWLSEIVYFPLATPLLQAARAHGLRVADGGHMAVGQAIGAFERFTRLEADAARMEAVFRALLAEREKGTAALTAAPCTGAMA